MKAGKLIHVMGTGSNAGKSTIAMALCRIISQKGYSVSPFKAMNMSLNSISTGEGDEISRAQWLQAKACGVEPSWRINPILLKPEGKGSSQIIAKGKSLGKMGIAEYGNFLAEEGRNIVAETLGGLLSEYEYVIAEGSGSCAEINLYDRDISNTWMTDKFSGTGILVVNIENGGSFASIYGTKTLAQFGETLEYFIINNMRGDSKMLSKGIEFIGNYTGMKCLGIIPHMDGIKLPGEDSMNYGHSPGGNVGIIRYPQFENYSDLDPLRFIGNFRYITTKEDMAGIDSIILPGSKNVESDLKFMKSTGIWDSVISHHLAGKKIIGICGGYQMLSCEIDDPHQIQLKSGHISGMGILDCDFEYRIHKTVRPVEYEGSINNAHFKGKGYEIRFGNVRRNAETAFLKTNIGEEGSMKGNAIGTNVHGILEENAIMEWLTGIRPDKQYDEILMENIILVSDIISANLNIEHFSHILNGHRDS